LRLHDLGEQVHLSQSALSRLITRLEKAGLVTRCVCEDDRRSVWTELTPLGAQRYSEARPTHRAILTELAAGRDIECEQTTTSVS
jgi:DNA-binding MarR family transcriptional regulator